MIVALALFFVNQHLVGFTKQSSHRLGLLADPVELGILMSVWMVFLQLLVISLPNFTDRCLRRNAQEFVIILPDGRGS